MLAPFTTFFFNFLSFFLKVKGPSRNVEETVYLVIQETKGIPDLYFPKQTRFDLKSITRI